LNKISALIIAPSRELVEQIHNQIVELIQVEIKNSPNHNIKTTKKIKKNKNKNNESKNEPDNEPDNELDNEELIKPSESEFKPLFKICKIVGGIYEDKD